MFEYFLMRFFNYRRWSVHIDMMHIGKQYFFSNKKTAIDAFNTHADYPIVILKDELTGEVIGKVNNFDEYYKDYVWSVDGIDLNLEMEKLPKCLC